MTSEDFKAWREQMGWNRSEAAQMLGLGRNMPQKYEDGIAAVPSYVALACSALAAGLNEWPIDRMRWASTRDDESNSIIVTITRGPNWPMAEIPIFDWRDSDGEVTYVGIDPDSPTSTLRHARNASRSTKLPIRVRLQDGIAWSPEWGPEPVA